MIIRTALAGAAFLLAGCAKFNGGPMKTATNSA